ncbi:MAG: alpha/beta hydrolase [Bacteroidales bacterium]
MRHFMAILVMSVLFLNMNAGTGTPGPGTVTRVSLSSSETGEARNIDIWLPEDYDTTKKYAVIYMHDGQMLFDSTTTWNRQEWGADETVSLLMAGNQIKPSIIVGIWNNDKIRYPEYYPEKSLKFLGKRYQARLARRYSLGQGLADKYLRFIAMDIKPYIDSRYSTYTDAANTVIMGSSMGGLISLYALCEYPDLFGGAGCLSTHSPMKGVNLFTKRDNRLARAFRKYLSEKLPDPENHQIYFDYGTETLDKFYEPYQKKIDAVMESKGYSPDTNWKTIKYEGDDHSERSWSRRLDIPLIFLLRNLPV